MIDSMLHRRDTSGKPVRPWVSCDGNEASTIHAWPVMFEPVALTTEEKRQSWADFAEREIRKDVMRELEKERRRLHRELRADISAAQAKAHETIAQEIKEKKRAARTDLGRELKSSRKKLRSLYDMIESAEESARKAVFEKEKIVRREYAQRLLSARGWLRKMRDQQSAQSLDFARQFMDITNSRFAAQIYPDVPPPMFGASLDGLGLPCAAGVYFLWRDGTTVEYVGKSINLLNRVRLRSHHRLMDDHQISFLVFDPHDITWAECYYIGVLRPQINFGMRASHNKQAEEE